MSFGVHNISRNQRKYSFIITTLDFEEPAGRLITQSKCDPELLTSVFVSRLEHGTYSTEFEAFMMRKKIDMKEIKQSSHNDVKYKAYKATVTRANYHGMFNLCGAGVNVDKFRLRTDQFKPR